MEIVKRKIEKYWNENCFLLKEFFAFCELHRDDYDNIPYFEEDVRLVFDSGKEHFSDESLYIESGKIGTSSRDMGVVHWDNDQSQYIKHFHFHIYEMGQLKQVCVHEDDYKRIVSGQPMRPRLPRLSIEVQNDTE